jgi:anti-sigma B factor antagonist
MPSFDTIRDTDAEGRAVLRVVGEVDLATAHDLVVAATSHADVPVRLDLSGVTFIDSTGISALLEIRRSAERVGGRVELVERSAAVDKVMSLAGISQLFGLEP